MRSLCRMAWIVSIVLLIILQKSYTQEVVNLTILHDAVHVGAVCLDGSPPAYYFRRGNSSNWLVFLQGGSWCYGDNSERSCLSRSMTSLGSSTQMKSQFSLNFGIFNISRKANPDFWNWNHVWINYCDGGSFAGNVDEPVVISPSNKTRALYYRGFRIWKYIMDDLLHKGMQRANKAILSGCSAGAVATALLCNDFKTLLTSVPDVKCLMDGGLILDLQDLNGSYYLRSIFKTVVKEHNITVGVERQYVSPQRAYQQLLPQYLLPSIKPPLFLLNPAYDTWQIRYVLRYPTSKWKPCVEDPSSCERTQLEILQGFRMKVFKNLQYAFARKDWGLFINSCFHHCQSDQSTVKVSNQTILETVGHWSWNKESIKAVDFLPWPNFWNWNHVWINYCDLLEMWMSLSQYLLETRGLRIWKYIMNDLLHKGMKHANKAILSGCSAGGVATALLCNDFKALLTHVSDVKCLMDGGLILDLQDLNGSYYLRSIFKAVVKEHNIQIGVERQYVSRHRAYQQLFPQYLLPSIKPPMFLLNSAYDTWQIRNVLQYPTSKWRPCVEDPSSCQHSQLEILQGFRTKLFNNLRYAFSRKDWGLFINSCFHHCQGDQLTVKVCNQTILETLGHWSWNRERIKAVDFLPWPSNPTCVTYFEDTWL